MLVAPRHSLNLALRNNALELVQSSFSIELNSFTAPNIEYSLGGLTGYAGENWRFLHQLFFKINDCALKQTHVTADWKKNVYEYDSVDSQDYTQNNSENKPEKMSVTYSLGKSFLKIEFKTRAQRELLLKPLIDIRHMYEESAPLEHEVTMTKDCVQATRKNHSLTITPSNEFKFNKKERIQHWRFSADNEERLMLDAGVIETTTPCEVKIFCTAPANKPITTIKPVAFDFSRIRIKKKYSGNDFASNKINALSTFCLNGFPEAGGLWFRNNWFRDALEGITNNYKYYSKTSPAIIKNCVAECKKTMQNGLIANKYAEKKSDEPSYNAVDSTLLYYLLCLRANCFNENEFKKTLSRLRDPHSEVFLDGLLYCPSNYSWTDEVINGKSTRTPADWNHNEKTALVEINALWISLVNQAFKKTDSKHLFRDLIDESEAEFKRKMSSLPHAIQDGRQAENFHSAKIVALALLDLPEEIVRREFQKAAPYLAYYKGSLFGVATNPESDSEYQGKTVWPRDTPYLLKTLYKLEVEEEASELILNLVEQTGNCLFYSQEAYSFPDLRPLKNPIQYWSHFVDPLLE